MASVLDHVRAAHETIAAEAAANEQARQLSPATVAAIRDAGVFGMLGSEARGGPALSPVDQVAVLEALAQADGAAGWCGMINSDSGFCAAYLDPSVAKELLSDVDDPAAFVANPVGRAVAEGDGYRVDGQWAFASGSHHAEVFFLNCLVFDGDAMRTGPNGMPSMRVVAVPKADVSILDTWHTTGLAGTGSNDVKVANVHVAEERTFDLFTSTPVDPSALYAWNWMFIMKMPGVPLGIARAAIEDAKSTAATKFNFATFKTVNEDPTVQESVAKAEALVRSARCYVDDALGHAWETIQVDGKPTGAEWTDCRLAITNAFVSSKQAVTLLYEALGTTGIYRHSRLDRQLRDVITMQQHVVSQTKTFGAAGRRLLGLDPGMIGF